MKIIVLSVIPVAGSVKVGEQTINAENAEIHAEIAGDFDANGDPLLEPHGEGHLSMISEDLSSRASSKTFQTSAERRGALMNAVGHRDAHKIASVVQELAHESIGGQAQTFDHDMREALKVIRTVFVKSIHTALQDSHKVDQNHINCFTQDCFGGCIAQYNKTMSYCDEITTESEKLSASHRECRKQVHTQYVDMAKKCGALTCFNVEDEKVHRAEQCTPDTCTAPDLWNCHKKANSGNCEAHDGDVAEPYGGWLKGMIDKFQASHSKWETLYDSCKAAYQLFMEVDMKCDVVQTKFERTTCERNHCEASACSVDYDRCEAQCWEQYQEIVQDKQCLEKDRKIDWSATKKIECYIDVLLHNYTKEDLAENCQTEDCINKKREADYNACAEVCVQIDYEGDWPEVLHVDPVKIQSTPASRTRRKVDEYHLGDGSYECDANGEDIIFTKHRGDGEDRCTEHLDIDYQVPQCMACKEPPFEVCGASFLQRHYGPRDDERGFDDTTRIDNIRECLPDQHQGCFPDVTRPTTRDGTGLLIDIDIPEHSHAWGFNRCPCVECSDDNPGYPGRPDGRQCGMGVHTMNPGPHRAVKPLEYRNVCVEPKGGSFATFVVEQDVCVSGITLDHLRGKVSCRHDRVQGDSNWGCDGDSLGLVMSDGDQVTAPVFDTTVGMTPQYSHHAHWYRMDGVDKNSEQMTWIFTKPFLFKAKDYKLWYNEALSATSEEDNHGRACYNLAFEPTEDAGACSAGAGSLAPLQYRNVCVESQGDAFHRITLPENTCVTEIALHHIEGWISCTKSTSSRSNFGCSYMWGGLYWLKPGEDREVIMPKPGQLEGMITYGGHSQSMWWKLRDANGRWQNIQNARTVSMKVKDDPIKISGEIDLWYGQDHLDVSEHNNVGRACYEVSVHRALSC